MDANQKARQTRSGYVCPNSGAIGKLLAAVRRGIHHLI
jgi:hypothetical protein